MLSPLKCILRKSILVLISKINASIKKNDLKKQSSNGGGEGGSGASNSVTRIRNRSSQEC